MNGSPSPALRSLLAASLGPGPLEVPRISGGEWAALWSVARAHSLTPYLHRRWEEAGLLERLPPEVSARFAQARALNTERNRRILHQLGEMIQLLEGAGLPVLVLKGLPLARAGHRDPGLRVLYDLDLLVRDADLPRALHLLGAIGYTPYDSASAGPARPALLWRPAACEWDAEGVFDPDRPVFVDLHLLPWEPSWHGFDLPAAHDWIGNSRLDESGEIPLRVLAPEHELLQLSVHYACNALESRARLMHLLDIGLLLRAGANQPDWDLFTRLAATGHLSRFCCLSLELARRLCRADVPGHALERLRSATPPRIVRWLEGPGPEAALGMSMYRPDRPVIYFLHWNMASDRKTRSRVLAFALRSAAGEARGFRRWAALFRRTAARLRHILGSGTRDPQ